MIPADITAAIEAADYVVGSDECGYGAWAGPLVVCAVVISKDWPLAHLVRDSKDFNGSTADKVKAREKIAAAIIKNVTFVIVSTTPKEIDEAGSISKVLPMAHGRAIDGVIKKHESMGVVGSNTVIVDGTLKVMYGSGKQALSLPKADALIPAVSAASILGKVAHDRAMLKYAQQFPGYGFENNKGYGGNPAHNAGLQKLGPCEIHRRTFGPIRKLLEKTSHGNFDFSDLGGDDE